MARKWSLMVFFRSPILFFCALGILSFSFSVWLMVHTFSFDPSTSSIRMASKVWSDFGSHIPLIRSFSYGSNLTDMLKGSIPEYPIFPGVPIRYHFLFYAFVGLLERLGMRIDWALNIPSSLGMSLFLMSVGAFAYLVFKDKRITLLSLLFLLFNGSFGFLRFFELFPLSIQSVSDIINNTQFPAFAPWGPGDVAAFWNLNIYTNQRHLAAGYAFALLFLITCIRIQKRSIKTQLLAGSIWGILFGILPFFHQPMLLVLAISMAWYFLTIPKLRVFLLASGMLGMLVILPQLTLVTHGESLARWYPGYLIANDLSLPRALWYWIQNLGIHFFLIPIGFVLAKRSIKILLFPMFLVFLLGNLVVFSPEPAANHKFFNFFMILGNMLTAYTLCYLIDRAKHSHALVRLFVTLSICQFVIILTLSGIIDFFAVANDNKITLQDMPQNTLAMWFRVKTPPDSIVMNSQYFFHPASLAGRKIFLGWPYFSWSAGYSENRMGIMNTVYESKDPNIFCPILLSRGIDYLTVQDTAGDPNLPKIDISYYLANFRPLYASARADYFIFAVSDLCR